MQRDHLSAHFEALTARGSVLRDYQSEIVDNFDRLVARGIIDKAIGAALRDRTRVLLIDRWVDVEPARQREGRACALSVQSSDKSGPSECSARSEQTQALRHRKMAVNAKFGKQMPKQRYAEMLDAQEFHQIENLSPHAGDNGRAR